MSNTTQRRTRMLLLAAILASPLLAVLPTEQANAQARFDIRIGTPPPPPRVIEARPRAGYVYTPGYWQWNGRRHVWVDGRYVRERRGYRWDESRWDNDGDRYRFHRGGWVRN
jgi:hypothetical protein